MGAAHVCFKVADIRATKAAMEAAGVEFYSDVNVVDEGPLAGWRWCYFSDPDGLALELVEIAYYLKDERDAASAEYLRTRPSLEDVRARLG
jgi:catechol 2,3-dioxygenase-like lactoylglutathione lyase family enzyme